MYMSNILIVLFNLYWCCNLTVYTLNVLQVVYFVLFFGWDKVQFTPQHEHHHMAWQSLELSVAAVITVIFLLDLFF